MTGENVEELQPSYSLSQPIIEILRYNKRSLQPYWTEIFEPPRFASAVLYLPSCAERPFQPRLSEPARPDDNGNSERLSELGFLGTVSSISGCSWPYLERGGEIEIFVKQALPLSAGNQDGPLIFFRNVTPARTVIHYGCDGTASSRLHSYAQSHHQDIAKMDLGPNCDISYSFPFVRPRGSSIPTATHYNGITPLGRFISVILQYVSVVVFHNELTATSTLSSITSFPYSVTSISSQKSRKNVLYPRRVRPLPVAVPLGHSASVSPDALIWRVRFLCTTLLPYAETRLVPAGRVLLQSLGLHGDFSQHAVSAGELEGPCKLLHTTFKDISFKLGAFSAPKLNEEASSTEALELERFSSVLRALSSVMDAFEVSNNLFVLGGKLTIHVIKEALRLESIKSATAKDGALRDQHRMALLELSVSTGLTMEQYRKKLDQNLAQTQTRLDSFLGQTDPGEIPTIEEGSEAEGEESSANSHAQSHSTPSHSHSDRGKRTNSLRRRILRRLLPSSMGTKKE
ncbi:hypothetical protein EDB92DRAFT_1977146 [Lactarius akahatsu]|uniref:Uncharacterized protein n=1 Tax=Lactarius akahatsu TaxID=416441 RepID=A0AAD4Q830_9AGAM|nr:hypothetical protein EDB92DRAFT_1977146 [Lactarius akahatsu]